MGWDNVLTDSAKAAAAWISGLAGCGDVHPCIITIGSETFAAVRYTQWEETRFYFLGEVPKSYRRRKKTVYLMDGRTWYVAGGWTEFLLRKSSRQRVFGRQPKANENHPLGANWLMMAWGHTEPIDQYDPHPYTRVEGMRVELI